MYCCIVLVSSLCLSAVLSLTLWGFSSRFYIKVTAEYSKVQSGDSAAADWIQLMRVSCLSSNMLFVGSDRQTGNSRMIQRYRVRIYDNVPWGAFP